MFSEFNIFLCIKYAGFSAKFNKKQK